MGGGWHVKLSVLKGEWAQSRSLALIVPLLQLGLPGGSLACSGVGMATSSWESLPCPSRPVSNATSLEKPQPPSEHPFPSYVVICVHTVVWWSKTNAELESLYLLHRVAVRVPRVGIHKMLKACFTIIVASALV